MKLEVEDKEKRLQHLFNLYDLQYKNCKRIVAKSYVGIVVAFIFIIFHSFIAVSTMDYLHTFGCLVYGYFFKEGISSLNKTKSYLFEMMDFRNETLTMYIPENSLIIWDRRDIS